VSILDHVSPKKGHHHRTDVTGSTQAQAVCGGWAGVSGRGDEWEVGERNVEGSDEGDQNEVSEEKR
jgi:hypothetical protein